MKKTIVLVATLTLSVSNLFSQDLTSKKGEPILPEKGDYSISIDATPFLNYMGNFFGKGGSSTVGTGTNQVTTAFSNQAPTFNFFTRNNTITGKYFKDANTAYRASLNIGFGGPTVTKNVAAPTSTAVSYPDPPATVQNKWRQTNTKFGVSLGIEKRRGKTRLQGLYGADAGIWIATTKNKFTYGNSVSGNANGATQITVNANDEFTGAGNTTSNAVAVSQLPGSLARASEIKPGSVFSIGVRTFLGAEYFILPKMSIGGEFGWGIGYSISGKSKTTWESVGTSTGQSNTTVGSTQVEGEKISNFNLGTDNNSGAIFGPSGALRLSLYF